MNAVLSTQATDPDTEGAKTSESTTLRKLGRSTPNNGSEDEANHKQGLDR